jgi:hypothetical protein
MLDEERAATWYRGTSDTETGRVITLDDLTRWMPGWRRDIWQASFWRRVARTDDDACCWIWRGTRASGGYGILQVNRQPIRAHRLSYLLEHGQLSMDRFVLHRCARPLCVRPTHLYSGTAAENARDMIAQGRWANRKLTDDDVRAIIRDAMTGVSQHQLALRFQVAQSTVWRVVKGRTFRHIRRDQELVAA